MNQLLLHHPTGHDQASPLIPEPEYEALHQAEVIESRYLPRLPMVEGMVLVKSPKGTGKTEALETLVKNARLLGKSVLVILHRKTLARALAARLGLECYLDDEVRKVRPGGKSPERPRYYAISIDSLHLRLPSFQSYDIVIMDEVEQGLSHVCSETVREPWTTLLYLQHYITEASAVYALDADLNNITKGFLARCRRLHKDKYVRLVLNTYVPPQREMALFPTDRQLTADLVNAARAGQRIVVMTNSKTMAKTLARLLKKEIGSDLRLMLITGEESNDEAVRNFVANITREILDFDVVIASPAIGTGIDITFENNAALVDVLYGFFKVGINAHYDIDQQLGRVRNPKDVRVWISPQKQRFETDVQAIKLDLIESNMCPAAVEGIAGRAKLFNANHPLLCLQADTYSAQRASQNDLKHHFITHKRRNGWTIREIEKEDALHDEGSRQITSANLMVKAEKVDNLLQAKKISTEQYIDYQIRRNEGKAIGTSAVHEIERYDLEKFYEEEISEDLVRADQSGKQRKQVRRYEAMSAALAKYDTQSPSFETADGGVVGDAYTHAVGILEALLLSSGLVDGGGFVASKVVTKDDLSDFAKLCSERRMPIERELKIEVRGDLPRDPIKMLNRLLDLVGQKCVKLDTRKEGKEKIYRYRLDPLRLDRFRAIAERRALAERKRAMLDDDEADALLEAWRLRQAEEKKVHPPAAGTLEALFESPTDDAEAA